MHTHTRNHFFHAEEDWAEDLGASATFIPNCLCEGTEKHPQGKLEATLATGEEGTKESQKRTGQRHEYLPCSQMLLVQAKQEAKDDCDRRNKTNEVCNVHK
jgi:hypothetical protein